MPRERQEEYRVASFSQLTGGINLASPSTMLAENEAQDILNMEFDFNRIRTRGGIGEPLRTYATPIKSIFYVDSSNSLVVVLENGDVWLDNLSDIRSLIGALSGPARPCFCCYDNKVFIASGNKLQYSETTALPDGALMSRDPRSLETIVNSKLCDNVTERNGRLVISGEGDDTIYFSAVGDPYETGWEVDSNDDSSSQWVEVGYKDDGDIVRVVPVGHDLIIFKSNGRIYNLSGDFPNWVVTPVAQKSDVKSKFAIDNVSGAAVFINGRGLMALQPSEIYGNFNIKPIGNKFNRGIKGNVVYPRTYNLYRKYQLMICPNTVSGAKDFWCFQHDIGAATRIKFPVDVADMVDTPDGVIIASGNALYRWSDNNTTDNGTPITSRIVMRELMAMDKMFTRRLDFDVAGDNGNIHATLNGEGFSFPINARRHIKEIYTNGYYANLAIEATAPFSVNSIFLYYVNA